MPVLGPVGAWVLVAVLVVGLVAGGCGGDGRDGYCEAVEEHQAELSGAVAGGGPTALLAGLPVFRTLAEEAPADIEDEWSLLVDRVAALDEALGAAGVEPAAYDAERPPAGLSPADRDRIARAARDLGSDQTRRALADLEQQALDVCGTPLVL